MATHEEVDWAEVNREPRFLRAAYIIAAALYPLWHLAAPKDAIDPWLGWWLVAGTFLVVSASSLFIPAVNRNLMSWLHLCSWLVTLQLYLLAQVNDMHPFYAIGSVMAVLTTVVFIRTRRNYLAFAAFVTILSVTLFAIDPDEQKVAYWGGMLTAVAALYRRLTVQLAAAATHQRHQTELEQRVSERTHELSEAYDRLRQETDERARLEEALRFSQKMEAVGRLAGGVAHEFNNLLTTIGIYAELLEETLPPSSQPSEEVRRIQKAQRQAAGLTQQLLTFSRRDPAGMEVVELNAIVSETSEMFPHLFGEDVTIETKLGPGCYPIRANSGELEQVLVNLALNSRDAMPGGGVFSVESGVLALDSPKRRELGLALPDCEVVWLAVSDTGVGMDAETRARAFDPFFTRKPVGKGTGLGLSIAYGIVTQSGGQVRIVSDSGTGARIEFYWPRASEPALPEVLLGSDRAEPGGRERILLVEDEVELRSALHRILSRCGYHVTDAEDADVALRIVEGSDEEFDLVLTDVVMPHKNGLEFAEQLREAHPEAKILLVSGHLNHPSLKGQSLSPSTAFLRKPFVPSELIAKVRDVLDGGRDAGPRVSVN